MNRPSSKLLIIQLSFLSSVLLCLRTDLNRTRPIMRPARIHKHTNIQIQHNSEKKRNAHIGLMTSILFCSIDHTNIHYSAQHNILFFSIIVKLPVSIGVDHHKAFCTNPQNQGKILSIGRSLECYNIYVYYNKIVILIIFHKLL
jgi:hypothetical protein